MYRQNQKSVKAKGCYPTNHICSVCCIIPPHLLKEIAKRGTPQQSDWAFQSLTHSARIRGQRDVLSLAPASTTSGEKRRTIYDASQGTSLPGKLVRSEGDAPSNDPAVNEAYDAAGATFDFYKEAYQRNSVDARGLRLDSTVHYNVNYDNAFWNGSQMVYGDGDGQIFTRFTKSIDVIGHELTHGVTQYEAGLRYQNEPGALNESMSDVFGSLVKQRVLNQKAEQADWIIGAGLLVSSIKGVGIRSMKAPGTAYDDPVLGKDPQPAHLQNLYKGTDDNGGVHINSSIPNHAFYLAAIDIGGYAWEKTGKIWYITLQERLHPWSNFARAAYQTISVAGELYGRGSKEQNAVRNGWKQVGVEPGLFPFIWYY
ncbi:MAG: M4 family metallopeptidase [Nostoc sp.]|uniref:M4 family metallopeptidase n=1 Tax=Nostoc sp. TaxID=1180 RepID=UPI002FFCCC3D